MKKVPETKKPRKAGSQVKDWREALSRLEGAYSENTLRTYRCDFEQFEAWCTKKRRAFLPASPATVAAFIADQHHLATSSLKRRQSAIRKVHKIFKLPNPVDDEDVVIALRRAMRARPRRQKQAKGLTVKLRDQLIAAAGESIIDLRNVALVSVGYDTLCRRSELANLRVEDLQELEGGVTGVLIRRAKNDPFGDGRMGILAPETTKRLNKWLIVSGVKDGWIFRRFNKGHFGTEPIHPFSISRILKIMAEVAGLDKQTIKDLSGHSMRVGAAQDMMKDGFGILPIMKAGGWKSLNIVGRYVENTDLLELARYRSVAERDYYAKRTHRRTSR